MSFPAGCGDEIAASRIVPLPRRGLLAINAAFLGLSALFCSKAFLLTDLDSHAILDGDPALMNWQLQWVSRALYYRPPESIRRKHVSPAPQRSRPDGPYAVARHHQRASLDSVRQPVVRLQPAHLPCLLSLLRRRLLVHAGGDRISPGGLLGGHLLGIPVLSGTPYRAPAGALLPVDAVRRRRPDPFLAGPDGCADAGIVCLLRRSGARELVPRRDHDDPGPGAVRNAGRPPTVDAETRGECRRRCCLCAAVLVPTAIPYRRSLEESHLGSRYPEALVPGDRVSVSNYLEPPLATLAGQMRQAGPWIWGEQTLYVGYTALRARDGRSPAPACSAPDTSRTRACENR